MEQLFFADLVPLAELCSISVSIPPLQTPCGENTHQPTVIKCRELIFTEPGILATPLMQPEGRVMIIMQQSMFKTGKLQNRLSRMGLQADKPRRVSPGDFRDCFRYTLQAKLAPAWNQAGEYLLQGRDFLQSRAKMNAVQFELHVTESEFYMALRGHIVRMSPLKLSDLGVCLPVVREFHNSRPRGTIPEHAILNKWCQILPSLKKGQVVAVSHTIPTDSPFRCYRDIKRHWKNTYGYRLPEEEGDVLYYQVYFRPIGEVLFTYPEYCLRPNGLFVLPRVDPRPIVQAFLQDVATRLPVVCGRKLNFRLNEPRYLEVGLNPMAQHDELSNLSERAPTPTHGYRKLAVRNVTTHALPHPDPPLPVPPPALPHQGHVATEDLDGLKNIAESYGSNSGAKYTFANRTSTGNRSFQNTHTSSQSSEHIGEATKKYIPIFKSQIRKPSFKPTTVTAPKPKFIPSFSASVKAKMPAKQASDFDRIYQNNQDFLRKDVHHGARIGAGASRAPLSTPVLSRKPAFSSSMRGLSSRTLPSGPSVLGHASGTSTIVHSSNVRAGLGAGSMAAPITPMTPKHAAKLPKGGHTPTLTQRSPSIPGTPNKRKYQDAMGTPKSKTPRAAPKVQADADVPALAFNGQLSKVNAVTLVAWLKDKGVACKAKEKKNDLMFKVNQVLNIQRPEA